MKEAYPTFIKKSEKGLLVYVPDFNIYTEGKNMADAIYMARDAIGVMGISYEDMGKEIPKAETYEQAMQTAKDNADDDMNFSDGMLTLVDVDFDEYRRKNDNRRVKKNCTIPYYLNVEAEKRKINFSRVLQEALEEKLAMN